LFDIAQASGGCSLLLGLGQRRQEHRRQNGNDGNNHQQFNQCESSRRPVWTNLFLCLHDILFSEQFWVAAPTPQAPPPICQPVTELKPSPN
jgi:hypothetical protein